MIVAAIIIIFLGSCDSWFIKSRSKKHIVISRIAKLSGVLLLAVGISEYTAVFDPVFKFYLMCSMVIWIVLSLVGIFMDMR
jgi:hypothetical protein